MLASSPERVTELLISPMQCRMSRIALNWGVRELARRAQISPNTVARFERGEGLKEKTLKMLRDALETAGIEFIKDGVIFRGARR